jgi:hypothetical protein
MSSTENRDKGNPRRWGNSQARALTWTTRLGGKAALTPASGLTLEAGQTGESESFAPLAHDLRRRVEARGDEVIGEPFGRHEDDPGADDFTIR